MASPPTFVATTDLVDFCAMDVARGLARLFHHQGRTVLCEVPLPNGRRADMVAIDGRGHIVIVEIKVARADVLADAKWPDYLDWCDRFYWAVSPALDPALLDCPTRQPDRCGLIVADRYDAAILREGRDHPLPSARRRAETLRLARLAMRRTMVTIDPDLVAIGSEGVLSSVRRGAAHWVPPTGGRPARQR
jgi:hypothetical protein